MGDNLTITYHSSGSTLRNVEIAGQPYNVTHLFCACDDATVSLAPRENDAPESVSVKINCPKHGELSTVASACGLTFKCETIDNQSIFAWVNERHEHDKRIAWGVKQRRTA